jgi:hypothetical protein
MKRKKRVEQRKQNRFRVREGAFAVLGDDISKLGQIIDICMGGLAFRYVAMGTPTDGPFKLDIFLDEKGFYLGSLPFKIISDIEIDHEIPFSSITVRRHGVQFGKLTHKQMSQLNYFIRNHTVGEL